MHLSDYCLANIVEDPTVVQSWANSAADCPSSLKSKGLSVGVVEKGSAGPGCYENRVQKDGSRSQH